MMIVEQTKTAKYPPFVWATDIHVKVGAEYAEISGTLPVGEDEYSRGPDTLRAYREAMSRYSGAKRQGLDAPHVQFANADSPAKRIKFIERYGPVLVSSSRAEDRPISRLGTFDFRTAETVVIAHQDLGELAREHLIYRTALVLISELRRTKKSNIEMIRNCISTIVSNISEWPRQWIRERGLRTAGVGFSYDPHWKFSEDNVRHLEVCLWKATREASGDPLKDLFSMRNPVIDGHSVICELVNAFAPVVYPWGNSPVEAPAWDLAGGVRPVLYYLLRREYLTGRGIALCRNSDCRSVFELERSGQEFCCEKCSRLQRQREYWSIRGKKLRKTRIARTNTNSRHREK